MNIGLVAVDRPCASPARPSLLSSWRSAFSMRGVVVNCGSPVSRTLHVLVRGNHGETGMREDQSRLPKTPVPANFADSTRLDSTYCTELSQSQSQSQGRTDGWTS